MIKKKRRCLFLSDEAWAALNDKAKQERLSASNVADRLFCGLKMDDKLRQILNGVLNSIIKRDDAPCSSETHLNMAVVELLKLLPEFNANDEKADAILYAIGEQLINYKHSV